MFKIRGADQKEYGPISADVLRQWIAERRADGRTMVQAAGATDWRPLSEFPEFAAALAAGPRPPAPPGPAMLQTPMPAGAPTTSGMAIASLICGVLGLCTVFTALIGLPLGIISLAKIRGSSGRLEGQGLAIAGICTSGLSLLMLPIMAALMLPALAKAKQKAQSINCMSQVKQLGLAVRMYANDNKDTFPPADTWSDSIQSYVAGTQTFRCNADSTGQRSSFAFNKKVAGKKEADVNPRTVIFFEVEGSDGWNSSGGREMMMPRSRHGQTFVVGFADGSAQQVSASQLGNLRWDP